MKMRIVGLGDRYIGIQMQYRGNWVQDSIEYDAFEEIMKEHFPAEYAMYAMCKDMGLTDDPAAVWFYNWGETRAMRRRGEAYVFGR